jgi:hypothetical protein
MVIGVCELAQKQQRRARFGAVKKRPAYKQAQNDLRRSKMYRSARKTANEGPFFLQSESRSCKDRKTPNREAGKTTDPPTE